MPLQTEARPKSFKQFLGNEEVVQALRTSLEQENHNHCMLISGQSGCGKTTLARVIARFLGAYNPKEMNNPGFREINASDFRGVDTVRMIREEALRAPLGAPVRVFFCDECHMLTRQAQEAFLKVLEEANGFNYFLFATTDPQMLSVTFKRRVVHYALQPLSTKRITELLESVCSKYELQVDGQVIDKITSMSNGSPGIAVGLLDMARSVEDDDPANVIAVLERGQAQEAQAIELCRLLVKRAPWKSVAAHLKKIKEQGEDPEGLRRMVLGYCSSVLLGRDDPHSWVIMEAFMEPTYNTGFPGIVFAAYQALAGQK